MIDIFLNFISNLTIKIFDKYVARKDSVEKGLYKLFEYYQQLCLLYEELHDFARGLENWKKSGYHGSIWSQCQSNIRSISHIIALMTKNVESIISILDFDFNENLTGFLSGKFNLFRAWHSIIEMNAREHMCGWISEDSGGQWRKDIYIPNYSFLMTEISSTIKLKNLKKSYWSEHLESGRFRLVYPDFKNNLNLLPELPKVQITADKGSLVNHYCKIIRLPDEEREIDKIIEVTNIKVDELKQILKKYGTLLKELSNNDINAFLRYI